MLVWLKKIMGIEDMAAEEVGSAQGETKHYVTQIRSQFFGDLL